MVSSLSTVLCGKDGGSFEEKVRTQCGFTRYPTLCAQTLTELGSGDPNIDLLSALVNSTISQTNLPNSNFEILTSHFISTQAQQSRLAIDYCHELMSMSQKRLKQAMEALKTSPGKHKADIQTWLSAALTFQETCKDSVEGHVPSNLYMGEVYKKMGFLSELGSNPLALANRIMGERSSPAAGRRLLERTESFPRWLSAGERKLLQSTEIKANAVVAKDGTGHFKTVTEAIEAASGGRYVIYVKAGTYNEKINTNKDGITLIGDGKYSTIITAGSSVGKGGSSLRGSATFTVTGDGFIARDIGFQNTAGPNAEQAVALTIASDHSVLYRCSLAGYQDTLYALSLRQFYRECDIYGTVDFIFGNAAAVFQSCTLYLRRPRGGGAYNVILANGRSDPGQNTGFSVQNCKITVASDFSPVRNSYKSYLGRPWKLYSRAVVMQSNIDGAISSQGWVAWPGTGGFDSLYFAEYANMGGGAGTSGRVKWPGFKVLGTPEASKFTVANLIGGNSWLPSTGVAFVSGL
ncbi:Plant invertase/pectin methylesterase inhibitor superfamily [Perilla frutescens var. hirtella]|nr:Plant invertase/pectin methylesterase inhibitor superfamily [Perilla frutescens var. hirtella]